MTTATVYTLHPDVTHDHVGFIPSFLNENDPRPAREQFNDNYQHGGGWRPFNGFTLNDGMELHYPDDPPQKPLAMIKFRNELIFIYESAWVLILQQDGTYEISRMD